MTHILIAFDSFKGSLSAKEACEALAQGLHSIDASHQLTLLPMADGGEGTLDCIQAARNGAWQKLKTQVAAGYTKTCKTLTFGQNEAAMEVAEAVGIVDLKESSPDVMSRHSGPAGKLLKHLIDQGATRISVGLGGSCTSDGGLGLLSELGFQFLNAAGESIEPFPKAFEQITDLKWEPTLDFKKLELHMLNDVDNPLCGDQGACAVYGPQKGLKADQIGPLDSQIKRIYLMIEQQLGLDLIEKPGAGAAGGLGAALYALGAEAKPGAEVLMELSQLEDKVKHSDLILTGEGRSDSQTLSGKLPKRIADMASQYQVPVILIAGGVDLESHSDLSKVFKGVFSISNGPNTLEQAMTDTPKLLVQMGVNLGQLIQSLPTSPNA